jgi:hypothetical protein
MASESALRKPTEMESMCAVYQELATPGAPHKLLAEMAGSWSVKSRWWMDSHEPPMESTGTSEQKMVLDGRFLQQDFSGDMMGSPFAGIGFTGYNNHTGKFVSTWMDSMGTGIYYFEGSAGADGKTITQTCSYDDPVRGSLLWRSVTMVVDGNRLEFKMYTTDSSGKEDKMGEMTYTRKS